MDKFFVINDPEADIKNILITEIGIKALDKNLETKENFLKSFDSESNNLLGIKDEIDFNQIFSISTYNDDFGLQLKYTKRNGKNEIAFFNFDSYEDREEVKSLIVEKTKLKNIDHGSELKKEINKRLLITMLSIFLMALVYFTIELPPISLYIFIALTLGLFYWIKIARTKAGMLKELYNKPLLDS